MGDYLFYAVCLTLYAALAWALVARPAVLDGTWARVRALPLVAKPFVWVAFLPWLSTLAIWESSWRTPRARLVAAIVMAAAFIAFWTSITFGAGGAR